MKYSRLFTIPLGLLLTAAVPADAEGVFTLKSGETLPGTPNAIQGQYMNIRSAILEHPVELDMKQLDKMEAELPTITPDSYSEITLSNGDMLYGTLKSLNDKQIKLETLWGGIITLERQYIKHIGFSSGKLYHDDITSNLKGWSVADNHIMPVLTEGSWLFRGGHNIELRKEMCQEPRMHVKFSVHRTATFRIMLSLWANKSNTHLINLSLTNSNANLSKRINGKYQNLGATTRSETALIENNDFTVDYFADREKGNYYLFIDGKMVGKWENTHAIEGDLDAIAEDDDEVEQEQPEEGFDAGHILRINSYSAKDMRISNMNIFSWNGAFPVLTAEPDAKHHEGMPKDKVLLNNGDVLRGTISLTQDGSIHVQSKNYDLFIPADRIRSLNQSTPTDKQPPPAIDADTRLFLNDRSSLSLTLKLINDGKLEVHSPVTGNITVPLANIKQAVFNLKDAELNKKRDVK